MLLEVRDLVVTYGDIRAVSGVCLELAQGELVSVIGANGAGKTSILSAVMGMVPARAGTIRFKGEDVTTRPSYRRARSGMRLVPERARLFP
ncbi:MAG TPA: ATP-binding cassette domain-containing protein, partial [Desulfobacterales bacterium]|nr:ATP-binding cassette domain-containing protein [Desulfobacterales bacterium]